MSIGGMSSPAGMDSDKNMQYFFTNRILRYIIAGCTTTSVDFIIYNTLRIFTGYIELSKLTGLCSGIALSYILNKIWTFHSNVGYNSILPFLILYGISNVVNIAINRFILNITGFSLFSIVFSFMVAAIVSAVINYCGMKKYVFKKSTESGP
jgi:putative flippase GtrA